MDWLYDLAHSHFGSGKLAFAVIMVVAFFAVIGVLLFFIDRTPAQGPREVAGIPVPAAGDHPAGGRPHRADLQDGGVGTRRALPCRRRAACRSRSCSAAAVAVWNNFANFRWAFTNTMRSSRVAHTLEWTLITPALATIIGLTYAYAIDKIRGEGLAKALIFLPTAISFVGAAVIWKLMYQTETQLQANGLVNVVLGWVGLGPLDFPKVGGFRLTLMMIVVMIWIQAGFATVVLSAAIKAVPAEIVEAAEIDGATQGQAFRRVVIPQIRPTLIVVMVTISIATLKVFDLIKTFGAQNFGADTLGNQMYTYFQQSTDSPILANRSAALAMIIFLLVIPFVVFQVRQMVNQRAGR